MAKKYDWERAKALYGLGNSYREIEKETGISYKAVERKAKSDGWIKGDLSQVKIDLMRVTENLSQMSVTEQTAVTDDVTKELKIKGYFRSASLLVLQRISDVVKEEKDLTKLMHGANGLKVLRQSSGIEPYFNTAPVIQNANIQGKQNESVTYEIVDSTSKIDFKGDK